MNRCRYPIAILLLTILGLALSLALGCAGRPDDPSLDNPFDPEGPSGGDPFQLSARKIGNTVSLSWIAPDHPDIAKYNILHSLENGGFSAIDTAAGGNNSYIHRTPAANLTNYYKVQAVNSAGETTNISRVTADSVRTPPYLEINEGLSSTASRFVTLTIGTRVGDTVWIADNADFADSTELAATPGDTTITLDWELTLVQDEFGQPADSNDVYKYVYLQVFDGDEASPVAVDSVKIDFEPRITIAGNPATVASNIVDLEIDNSGVDSMRLAASAEELATALWLAGADSYPGFVLGDDLGPFFVFGEFLGDFGFTSSGFLQVIPDDLQAASFVIADDAEFTDDALVEIHSDAVATQMRFSESPDLSDAVWIDYADTTSLTLSEGGGVKPVYGQFRNHWADSAVLIDWITFIQQDLDVTFIAPTDNAVIRGGVPFTVAGISTAASGSPAVDQVEVDLGDGWITASGTETWSTLWNVPTVTTDSMVTLRARATADTVMATTLITVIITQLQIKILGPTEGAEVSGGVPTMVNGTATPATNGSLLDLVELDLGNGWATASGLAEWSLEWIVPTASDTTEVTIYARVWAGSDSAVDSVSVVIPGTGGR
ncbi:MAG: hypothetical protein ABIF77_12935 [bacterium]